MNPHIFNYSIFPSIVRADRESTITIHPLGENALFKPGAEYTVTIRPVDCLLIKEVRYADRVDSGPTPNVTYKCIPNENGDLVVTHLFKGEQQHAILIDRPECDSKSPYFEINNFRPRKGINVQAKLAVYSLNEDLYGMRCYKGELHCHTFDSDGTQDAVHTVANYRSAGYDFIALTDHFTSFASEKSMRVFKDAPVDMTMLLGEEVHVPAEHTHILHFGGSESVNEYFRRHKDEVRKEVDEIKAGLTLPENVDPEDYAWRVWVANKCREFGGLSVLCHPYWVWNQMYFMSTATTELLLRNSVHDALDWTTTGVDLNAALWADLRAEGLHIPLVCSTDSHSTDCTNVKAPAQGGYTLLFAPDRTAESIKAAVRAERSLAVNDASTPETIYGPYRLVKFATFLMDNYFPAYARLCYGQGAVMCEYPVNGQPDEETVQLLTLLNKRSEAFAKGFFGY